MDQKNRVGFDWLTLFKLKEEEKQIFISRIRNNVIQYDLNHLCSRITIREVNRHDEFYKKACQIMVLNFCLKSTTFARDVLSDDNCEKCIQLYDRKQFDSKLLKDLLNKFCYAMYQDMNLIRIQDLLRFGIIEQVEFLKEQEVEKIFLGFKKQIEKIASGVKCCCYIEAERKSYSYELEVKINEQLNEYVKEQFAYDFNKSNDYSNGVVTAFDNRAQRINKIFQYALFNNEFWKGHESFNILAFLDAVIKQNDLSHAKKVIKYIFNEICKSNFGKRIVENSLPLVFLNEEIFVERLQERTFQFAFKRFESIRNLSKIANCKLCYPINCCAKDANEKLVLGKSLSEEFFKEMYLDDSDKVLTLLRNEIIKPTYAFCGRQQSLVNIEEKESDKNNYAKLCPQYDKWTIRNVFDSCTFGFHSNIADIKAVEVYCDEYFTAENIWNRFYLKMFYMQKLVNDKNKCFANMFEVLYDLFQFIEKITGIKTSYQRDTKGRDNAFNGLRTLLSKYNVSIADEYKADYVISLLDRKVANREESEKFPVLEQLGDAVYGLAVAEMLFYNPQEKNMSKSYTEYISAKNQVCIAEKIGFDKLYLSSYSLSRKYERDILINPDVEGYIIRQESEQMANSKKYIADSLEMVIGAICKDCGYQVAIDFCKSIVRETFSSKFPQETHWSDESRLEFENRYYWTKILPAPYVAFDDYEEYDDDSNNDQYHLWQAFDKFFKAYILGTEDKEIRNYITNSYCDNRVYDELAKMREVDKVFYEYLHCGLKSAVDKYGDSVKKRYEEIIKK